eukprot:4740997-Amphidinium_carterae.1
MDGRMFVSAHPEGTCSDRLRWERYQRAPPACALRCKSTMHAICLDGCLRTPSHARAHACVQSRVRVCVRVRAWQMTTTSSAQQDPSSRRRSICVKRLRFLVSKG